MECFLRHDTGDMGQAVSALLASLLEKRNTEHKQPEIEREKLIMQPQEALANVKTLWAGYYLSVLFARKYDAMKVIGNKLNLLSTPIHKPSSAIVFALTFTTRRWPSWKNRSKDSIRQDCCNTNATRSEPAGPPPSHMRILQSFRIS